MRVPISIAMDITAGNTSHVLYGLPDYLDFIAFMQWSPTKSQLTTNVFHKGQAIVLDGHDQGQMLPHLPCSNPVHVVKSSRKVMYSASTVQAQTKPIACVDSIHKMMVCGDPVSQWSGLNLSNSSHNVFVGTTKDDELAGDLAVLQTTVIDLASLALMVVTGGASKVGEIALETLGVDEKKATMGLLFSAASSITASAMSGWKKPITIKTDTGGGWVGAGGELTYNPKTRRVSGKAQGNSGLWKGETSGDLGTVPTGDDVWGGVKAL